MSDEVWKDIQGYEGYYQVSNMGRVRSLDRVVFAGGRDMRVPGCLMSPSAGDKGRLQVNLRKRGKVKTHAVHRLVLKAFVPNPQNLRAGKQEVEDE